MSLGTALYVHVIYRTHGAIVHSETLCRKCFEEMNQHEAFYSRERGKTIEVKPWIGPPRCSGCETTTVEDLRAAL